MPYILIGMYTRPLPASDTDGDRNTQVLGTPFFLLLLSMWCSLLTAPVSQVFKNLIFDTMLLISTWHRNDCKTRPRKRIQFKRPGFARPTSATFVVTVCVTWWIWPTSWNLFISTTPLSAGGTGADKTVHYADPQGLCPCCGIMLST